MITEITGVPGAGKTLRAVYLIMNALKAGRRVYTDIDGFSHPDVMLAPVDWRDTPEGSLVVYDEAQRTYPSTGKAGRVDDERITSLETHRHTGHDLIFITQAPTLIHHHIRKLVGLHIHVHRAAGLKRATLFTWDFNCDNPNDRREQERADTENWFYPKDLFQYYKSATIHTHKFNVPKKIAFALLAIFIVVGGVIYRLTADGGLNVLNLAEAKDSTQARSAQGDLSPAAALLPSTPIFDSRPVKAIISGGFVSGKNCRLWNAEGLELDVSLGDCLNIMSKPLPINIHAQLSAPPASPPGVVSQPVQFGFSGVGSNTPADSVGPPAGNVHGQIVNY